MIYQSVVTCDPTTGRRRTARALHGCSERPLPPRQHLVHRRVPPLVSKVRRAARGAAPRRRGRSRLAVGVRHDRQRLGARRRGRARIQVSQWHHLVRTASSEVIHSRTESEGKGVGKCRFHFATCLPAYFLQISNIFEASGSCLSPPGTMKYL